MKNMNCVSTMPEIMPEITDEAIIEALFAQRPYEEKVINSAFLEIPAEYQRKLNIPNVEKMSAECTELIANPPKVSYRENSMASSSSVSPSYTLQMIGRSCPPFIARRVTTVC